jgi:protein SCO1/2
MLAVIITIIASLTTLHRPSLDFDPMKGKAILPPQEIPTFTFIDQSGQPFTKKELLGHWSLLTIGYTYCPDVCPTTLLQLAAYINKGGAKTDNSKEPTVIFLSVDPFRDTRDILSKYVRYFNKSFIGISGQPEDIAKFVNKIGLYYAYSDPEDNHFFDDLLHKPPIEDYIVTHSSRLLIISPQGRLAAIMSYPYNQENIAEFIGKLQRYYGD